MADKIESRFMFVGIFVSSSKKVVYDWIILPEDYKLDKNDHIDVSSCRRFGGEKFKTLYSPGTVISGSYEIAEDGTLSLYFPQAKWQYRSFVGVGGSVDQRAMWIASEETVQTEMALIRAHKYDRSNNEFTELLEPLRKEYMRINGRKKTAFLAFLLDYITRIR